MAIPAEPTDPEALARHCTFVAEALRRWRLEPSWIADGPWPETGDLDTASALRCRRQLAGVRILAEDVAGTPVEETGRALSRLAEDLIETALAAAEDRVRETCGELLDADGRPARLAVIALGKLGGEELNFHSDVDLVFVHSAVGESDGPRRLEAREYLTRVAREMVRLLDEVTAEGRVWVVDTRLRPFGQAGALVWSTDAMEHYFLNEGRAWERYAWLKARPVAGDVATGAELVTRLQPFVFRRYLDYGLFASLRHLHREIESQGRAAEAGDDIKRGRGGIRELEFLVQSLQLLRGGRIKALQAPGFLPALAALTEHGIMAADDAAEIGTDYRYLRVLENRLQAVTGRQTHDLPDDPDGRERLAWIMGCDGWKALHRQISATRQRVARRFRSHFHEPESDAAGPELWPPPAELRPRLAEAGFRDPDDAAAALEHFAGRLQRKPLSAEARRRMDALMPGLLREVRACDPPDAGFRDLLALLETIARRSAYLALLRERPRTLERLVRAFHRSGRVARWIIAGPHLLDDLLDPVHGFGLPACPRVDPADPEPGLEALGRFRQAGFLRTALAQFDGSMDSLAARAQLGELAEQVLAAVTALTASDRAPFAVIGYGNLGAGTLHYESDLDLVFLHAGQDPPVRAVQRMINAMQLPLPGGKLYAIDTRLRPNGNAGLLVSGLEQFATYQQRNAWTWEHQALIRARWVAGDESLREPFEEVRRRVLTVARDADRTRRDLAAMRARQRRERDEEPGKRLLTDIQFIAEYGLLTGASDAPELIDQRRTRDQLQALADGGLLSPGDAGRLIQVWDEATARSDHAYLHRDTAPQPPPADAVDRIFERVLGGG